MLHVFWRSFFILATLFAIIRGELDASGCENLPTYFRYTPESLRGIEAENSSLRMSNHDLKKWDDLLQQLNNETPLENNLYRLR